MDDRTDVAVVVAAFADRLHRGGLRATAERAGRFGRAVVLASPARTDELYWLARTTFVTDPAELPVFDAIFDQCFRGVVDDAFRGDSAHPPAAHRSAERGRAIPTEGERRGSSAARPGLDGSARSSASDDVAVPHGLAADAERLATKDFAACSPDELALLGRLMTDLETARPRKRGRRTIVDGGGDRLDVRATLRRAHRTGGDPVHLVTRRRREQHRRLVLLADVSGSMEPYGRAYLWLLHGAVRAAKAEAFVFATSLTRVTPALREWTPDRAVLAATRAAPDWSGGTRIGDALRAFLDEWGRRGLARGAVVVIVSDGWESGEPSGLGEQMARLSRLAHRIVWVNPRAQSAAYQPLVGGMQAALPYVDALVSGHSLRAMDDVLAALTGPSWAGDRPAADDPRAAERGIPARRRPP